MTSQSDNTSKDQQPDSPEALIRKQILNAYSLGWGNAITGNKINEKEDIEAYVTEALAKLDEYYTNKFLELIRQHTRKHIMGNEHCICFTELRQAIKQLSKRGE